MGAWSRLRYPVGKIPGLRRLQPFQGFEPQLHRRHTQHSKSRVLMDPVKSTSHLTSTRREDIALHFVPRDDYDVNRNDERFK
jgi:hypothetical protein